MKYSVISGDVIGFTALSSKQKIQVEKGMVQLFTILHQKFDIYSRMLKGDYIEIVSIKPEYALQIALIIKAYIKSLDIVEETEDNRLKYFKIFAMRLAIGLGKLSRFDKDKGIVDGDAIYRAGRLINDQHTHQKKRIHIRQSLFVETGNKDLNLELDTILNLLDVLMVQATSKQSKVLYFKLLGYNDDEISKLLNITKQAVNQRSIPLGWNAIKKAVDYYNFRIKKYVDAN